MPNDTFRAHTLINIMYSDIVVLSLCTHLINTTPKLIGGAWDNSDVRGAKKKRWLSSDKEYADGGLKKSQSISILGEGQGLDWTGKRNKTGPGMSNVKPGKFTKNYQAPNVNALKGGGAAEKPKKKMFGLF